VLTAGIVAPLVAMQSVSMALAGTDMAQHRHFVAAAENYRRMMQRMLNDDIVTHQKPGEVYMAGADLWNRIPSFEYEAPSTTSIVRQQAPAIALLALWAVLATAAASWAVRRAVVA
jgi:ABC-2 type transport system permease protein